MSKEEILKIQKCVLKVNIHCDGCKHKVKKILQKIDGVYTTEIVAEQGKVTVSGNVDPAILIKKLSKSGKHAEIWGASKSNNQNQMKNMHIENTKGGGNNNKGQKGGNNNNQPKNGQQGQQVQNHHQNQLQQLQKMKGLNLNDLKMPFKGPNPAQKPGKFDMNEYNDMSDDELDDDYDEFDDDDLEDDVDGHTHLPPNKMKPMNNNTMMQQLMNAQKNGNGAGNSKKGGGNSGNGALPVPMNGNGGKKGGNGGDGGNNQNQGGKNGSSGGGAGATNNKSGRGANGNGGKNGGGMNNFQNMGAPNGVGGANNLHMGPTSIPLSGMANNMQMGGGGSAIPAAQGLAASGMNGGPGGGGYFQGAGPEAMPGNPYHQQQYLVAMNMMNQQRAMGNQPNQPPIMNQALMYARPPPAVNYMPPYPPPYAYPYPGQHDPYTHAFSDENPSSCNVM